MKANIFTFHPTVGKLSMEVEIIGKPFIFLGQRCFWHNNYTKDELILLSEWTSGGVITKGTTKLYAIKKLHTEYKKHDNFKGYFNDIIIQTIEKHGKANE